MEKEIGGYIELDSYKLPMLYEDGTLLNSGRFCLWYLIRAKGIKKLVIPWFCCDAVRNISLQAGVKLRYYQINLNFMPESIELASDEWLYIVNYYGQLTQSQIINFSRKYRRIIVDNAQAYFAQPVKDVDTLYTCRKFFGVPDGGILYTDALLNERLAADISWNRMNHLLGRFEGAASEFYEEYVENDEAFNHSSIKLMSKLTLNLLHGIDYAFIQEKRRENFFFLNEAFGEINKLQIRIPEGPFAYPLFVKNGGKIRNKLIKDKVYIPCLWPNVKDDVPKDFLEYDFAENILPLPVDQRYSLEDMECLRRKVNQYMSGN